MPSRATWSADAAWTECVSRSRRSESSARPRSNLSASSAATLGVRSRSLGIVCRARFVGRRLSLGQLFQGPLVVGRHDLLELRKLSSQSARIPAGDRRARCTRGGCRSARAVPRRLRLRPAARARPSPCCSWPTARRPDRKRRRCRRTCRPRNCGRSVPRITATPPVMYSQPWSPTPSIDGRRARIPHAEPFGRLAAEIGLAVDGPIQGDVADHDVLFGQERGRASADRR